MAVVVEIWTVKHVFRQRFLLRVSDEVPNIGHKCIVRCVSIHADDIVKALGLNAPETQERYMLAYVPAPAVAEEWLLSAGRWRVIFSIILPLEQISDRSVLSIVVEIPLPVAQELWSMYAEIAARDHRQVVGI